MRRPLENLFALLLRHTAQHAELFARSLQLFVIRQPMENFLLGLVPDRTRVVQDQVGLLHALDLPIPFLNERSHDLFRVVDVHLAAERFKIKSLRRIPTHAASITPASVAVAAPVALRAPASNVCSCTSFWCLDPSALPSGSSFRRELPCAGTTTSPTFLEEHSWPMLFPISATASPDTPSRARSHRRPEWACPPRWSMSCGASSTLSS